MSVPIDKNLDSIRTDMYGNIETVQTEYQAKGWLPARINLNKGVIRGLIELWCWGLHQLYQFMAYVLQMAFPKLSTGSWLDLHAGQVELTRRQQTKAAGKVVFMRDSTSGNVNIPSGRIVRTKPDGLGNIYRFVTTEPAVCLDGLGEVEVAVESEQYGSSSNVTAGQISEIVTVIPGIDSVENRSDWLVSEGVDQETDVELQSRYQLAWQGAGGATKYAYMSWALEVAGVVSVTILDNHPRGQGTVDVVIRSSAGIPTQALIDAVTDNISGREPINDDFLVKGPTPVLVDIDAEIVVTGGDPAAVTLEAENRLRALFGQGDIESALLIGQDVTMDLLIATAMGPNIKRIEWTSPAASVSVDSDGLGVLNSMALTYSVEEI